MPRYNSSRDSGSLHIQLRDTERRIISDALEFVDGKPAKAGALLGVSGKYLKQRALVIGGFLGHPVYEPPRTGATRPGYRDPSEVEAPAPEPEEPAQP